jgi:hypothetical protein
MRFGLDVAQQRMRWDEVVSRVQFAEELGFDGASAFWPIGAMARTGILGRFVPMTVFGSTTPDHQVPVVVRRTVCARGSSMSGS